MDKKLFHIVLELLHCRVNWTDLDHFLVNLKHFVLCEFFRAGLEFCFQTLKKC